MTSTRPYVLVVDDMADAAEGLVMLLGLWGFDAAACYCGCEALAAAQARRPAAVVLDIGMAPMDGFTLADRLRTLPGGERIALVAVSGHTAAAHQARGRDVGITHYLFKPADPTMLRALLGRLAAGDGPGRGLNQVSVLGNDSLADAAAGDGRSWIETGEECEAETTPAWRPGMAVAVD